MLYILAFACMYALKGDQFKIRAGRLLSILLAFAVPFFDTGDWVFATKIAAAWCVGVFPSMGEEAGAIGRWGYWWGKYKERGFSRSYGVKKALQRGCWLGACFTIATGSVLFLPAMSFGFVVLHFVGQDIYYRIWKSDDWKYSEPMIGALLGVCLALCN